MSDTDTNKNASARGEGGASTSPGGAKPAGDAAHSDTLTRDHESGMSEDEGVDTVKQDKIASGLTGQSKDAGSGSDDQDFDLNAED